MQLAKNLQILKISLQHADLVSGVLAVVHCPLLPAQPSKVDEPLLQAMELVEFVPGLGGQADVISPFSNAQLSKLVQGG